MMIEAYVRRTGLMPDWSSILMNRRRAGEAIVCSSVVVALAASERLVAVFFV
jgi:hypothetical protein